MDRHGNVLAASDSDLWNDALRSSENRQFANPFSDLAAVLVWLTSERRPLLCNRAVALLEPRQKAIPAKFGKVVASSMLAVLVGLAASGVGEAKVWKTLG